MTTPSIRNRSPWLYVLAGCLLAPLSCLIAAGCLLLALTANGLYWSTTVRGAAPEDGGPALQEAPTSWNADGLRVKVAALPAGDAEAGAQLFAGAGGCHACHALEGDRRIVGPALAGVGERAGTARADYTAAMYLYESIVAPDAQVAAGFPAGVMPGNFGARLSEQELADLVAFLLTR